MACIWLLDVRGQRGSWMPSKVRPEKFLTTFFLVVHQNLSNNTSPNIFDIYSNFSLFASVVNFHENSLHVCPSLLHALVKTCFSVFVIYLLFSRKLTPWMLPRWMGWAVAPSAPPLHATEQTSVNCSYIQRFI